MRITTLLWRCTTWKCQCVLRSLVLDWKPLMRLVRLKQSYRIPSNPAGNGNIEVPYIILIPGLVKDFSSCIWDYWVNTCNVQQIKDLTDAAIWFVASEFHDAPYSHTQYYTNPHNTTTKGPCSLIGPCGTICTDFTETLARFRWRRVQNLVNHRHRGGSVHVSW